MLLLPVAISIFRGLSAPAHTKGMAFPWVAAGTGTDQELLDAARAMKARINTNGQEYYIGSRRVVLPPLLSVMKDIKELEAKIAAAAGGASSVGCGETKVLFKRPL